jgi:hypothetical protein
MLSGTRFLNCAGIEQNVLLGRIRTEFIAGKNIEQNLLLTRILVRDMAEKLTMSGVEFAGGG